VSHSCARAPVGLPRRQKIARRRELLTLNSPRPMTLIMITARNKTVIMIDTPFERSIKRMFLIMALDAHYEPALLYRAPGNSAHAQKEAP
jgi:hypothetical protein